MSEGTKKEVIVISGNRAEYEDLTENGIRREIKKGNQVYEGGDVVDEVIRKEYKIPTEPNRTESEKGQGPGGSIW